MTRESNLWLTFKGAMPVSWHAVRIENSVDLGTPDVNLCVPVGGYMIPTSPMQTIEWNIGHEYWVELKVQEPPKRQSTLVRVEHFTMEQRQFLVDRTRAGGRAYLLLQLGDVYLWLRGDVAAVWVGSCTVDELIAHSTWAGGHLSELVEYLET